MEVFELAPLQVGLRGGGGQRPGGVRGALLAVQVLAASLAVVTTLGIAVVAPDPWKWRLWLAFDEF